MKKFWNWKVKNSETGTERILTISGTIAEDTWFDDDFTPKMFKDELNAGEGDVTIWINSPGGDCCAAAQIYNMLQNYKGNVIVKIDGIAASAASVIAMAGTRVLMSPVSMMMIHNPATIAMGDHRDMAQAIEMLAGVKESIINAYQVKTGLSRNKISKMMDAETWMDAHKAVELGFADDIMIRQQAEPKEEEDEEEKTQPSAMLFSRKTQNLTIINKIEQHCKKQEVTALNDGRSAQDVLNRLLIMKRFTTVI